MQTYLKDPHESDIQCAFRELEEETSIQESELWKVTNVAPIIEQFYGSNGINYRHSYYLAQFIGKRAISFNALNPEMAKEIGDLAWKDLDDAASLLRPENVEKKEVLIKLQSILQNLSPVLRSQLVGTKGTNENTSGEQQEIYVFTSQFSDTMEKSKRFFGIKQT